MKCPRCQQENPPEAKFCLECATPLVLRCVNCGTQLPAGAKFCFECAKPVGAPRSEPRFVSPEAYTPKHLAERILTSKAALEGERKQVTVLFADLKGSMELLADRDPEEARKILDPVLERMMEAVHRYEGTVNQVMGDGIMALFGAPLAHEDHAVRACYAALRMQESVKQYADIALREHGVAIRIRVGLNSGEVVVRAIGSDLHMDYTAVGQTTHLAARLEQLAGPGSILLAPDTLALVEGFVHVAPLGPMVVKGLAAPVEVYELAGTTAVRSRLQAATTRGLSHFVGRDLELSQLLRALDQGRQGRGQLVAVVGEPGMGKSRLTLELTRSQRLDGWLVLQAGAQSYGKNTSYLPVTDLLKRYFKLEDQDVSETTRAKVVETILTLDHALNGVVPGLLALLDAHGDDSEWKQLDPAQRRQRMLDAVKRLLLREAQNQPLLVSLEDLHWIDSETQALLESLVESLPAARILLLVNYRPEYQHAWASKTYYTQLRLDALPLQSANELLLALLGADASVEPIKPVLIARTGGNPLFLEESVRMLVETRALVGERGDYRLTVALADVQVPPSIQSILAARIDRLAPEAKLVLQSAAVIGMDVPFKLLLAIADIPEGMLHSHLAHLQAAEFLYEAALFPDLEYTFKHALTHEVAYGGLLKERRRLVHAQVVEAMEMLLHDNRLAEQVDRIGYHALRGELWQKALSYFRQAGDRAFAHSAHREATACFDQALIALSHLPATPSIAEEAIDIRLKAASCLVPLGELEPIIDHLRRAELLAESIGDQRRLAYILRNMSKYFRNSGDTAAARDSCKRALEVAEALADAEVTAYVNYELAENYRALGDYPRAIDAFKRTTHLFEAVLSAKPSLLAAPGVGIVFARNWQIMCLAEVGEFSEGTTLGEESRRIAERADNPFSLMSTFLAIGSLALFRGDLPDAIPLLKRAVALGREGAFHLLIPQASSALGAAYVLAGEGTAGLALLREAIEQAALRNLNLSRISTRLGAACLAAGLRAEAIEHAQRALDLSRANQEQGHEVYALHLLGEIASYHESADLRAAGLKYFEALGLGEKLGMRPLVAHCHLGLGKLYRRTGKREQAQAQEHLTTATTMYREMDMRFWLEQAEAEMRELTP
jgi:class 3 adenylate cyclase/tetratricopeptide (TPR) repeat protein